MKRLSGNVVLTPMKKIYSYANASGIRYTIKNNIGVKGGRISK